MRRRLDPVVLELLGGRSCVFDEDLRIHGPRLAETVAESSFLVIGGGGSIGTAVVKEIFARQPRLLHVVDISENNLAELVRDLRSSVGYIRGEFRALPLDCCSVEFEAFVQSQRYDFVANLAALKHVRSEKDPYSLMRMVRVNILNTEKTLRTAQRHGARKYFCVSTDKAAAPVNLMGASKRVMEKFIVRASTELPVSMARFGNVAFSDGSLLEGFLNRLRKRQPLAAPRDVRRYFMTAEEAGLLCLMSCVLGNNRDIFFPQESALGGAIGFVELAERLLESRGFEPVECASEEEARERTAELIPHGKWPCFYSDSDTTGEKQMEVFYTEGEDLDLDRFKEIGVIRHDAAFDAAALEEFERGIASLIAAGTWTKAELVGLLSLVVPELEHLETFKYLDDKM